VSFSSDQKETTQLLETSPIEKAALHSYVC